MDKTRERCDRMLLGKYLWESENGHKHVDEIKADEVQSAGHILPNKLRL